MKTLVLLILLNTPTGEQHIQSATHMPQEQCLTMQAAIWQGTSPLAYIDEHGPVFTIDAACVPVDKL